MAGLVEAKTTDRGFPMIDVYSAVNVGADVIGLTAVQGADGVLYFGSNSLLTFDGDRWRSHPIHDAYGLYALEFAPDGRLWAGARGEIGWFSRDATTWRYHSLLSELPPDQRAIGEVFDVVAYGGGAVFSTEDRLLHWDTHSVRTWHLPNSRRVRLLRSGGEVFVHHVPTGLYLFRDGELELLAPAEVMGDSAVFWLQRSAEGFLVLKNEGFFRLRDGKLQFLPSAASEFVDQYGPTRVMPLPDGRLAVGTLRNGLGIVTTSGAVAEVFNHEVGFENTNVTPLIVDRDGALWVGSRAAIARIALSSASTIFDQRASYAIQPVAKMTRYAGDLMLASAQGLYRLDVAQRRFQSIENTHFNDMERVNDALLLAGYRTVTKYREGDMSAVYTTDFDTQVVTASRQSPGLVYIGDGKSIAGLAPNGTARIIIRDLPDVANSIAEDASGALWIGTKAHGLFVGHPSNDPVPAATVPAEAGIPNSRGTGRAFSTPDGTVFAFTPVGAWVRRPGMASFAPVRRAPDQLVAAVTADAAGSGVWVIHLAHSGLSPIVGHITTERDGAVWAPHGVEGLERIGVPRAILSEMQDQTRTLWVGGTHGVLRHDLQNDVGVIPPRSPLLRAVAMVGDRRIPTVHGIKLPAATRAIEFEFAIPEFGRRRALQLETRIDGIDGEWVPVAAGGSRELTLVHAGHYTVRARAVAEAQIASHETVMDFEVLKPWWQTAPARSGAVLAIGLAAFGVYRVRVRTLRRRNVELEAKVRQRTEELERASAAKTEFVANMSHDIRNPLNGIVGLAYALEDSRLDERQRDMVATLRECTSYLSTLVDDVLDFASIEAGRVEIRPGPFNAAELLGSIATTLKADTIQSGATLVVECDPALPPHVLGDAGRIQQILVNYVSNALKYAGGTIRLSATLPTHATDEIEFAVTDFGPGLNESEKATLFTKFTRTAQARQHAIPGTGLGLAACRSLADIMGGSVGVISQPGEGASFFLRLPLIVATERPAEPTRALPNATVLLVEDTDYNALAATAVLERLGLSCERACTGEEAIRLFSEKRYNIVLLDRNLPDMDGTDVARRLRAIEGDGLRSILLAVTAYCTPEDRTRCIEAGMDAFVGKPLTPEKLRKVLLTAGRTMRSTSTLALHDETPAPVGELDTTLLSYLADGSQSGLMQQIARYVANLERTQRELAQKMTAGDGEALANTAHRLLGDARMINATALISAVTALENSARHGRLAECRGRLELVMTEIARVTEALYRQSAARTA